MTAAARPDHTSLLDATSAAARLDFETQERTPLFLGDWTDALFVHFLLDPAALAAEVPLPLDLWQGQALVSLVAFNMQRLRPSFRGALGRAALLPIASHSFLNVRTYVKHSGSPAIYFIHEWLNSRLATWLGPLAYGLPYRHARIVHRADAIAGTFNSRVEPADGTALRIAAFVERSRSPALEGTLDHFALERYTAFTGPRASLRMFRVWHAPWPMARAQARLTDRSALEARCPWFGRATPAGAHFSPGVSDVWMGRPRVAARENVV